MPGPEPMPVGAHGRITTRQLAPKSWEAMTRYRDPDGQLRRVRRTGRSRTAAENTLKLALSKRRHTAGSGLTGTTRVHDAAQRWLARQAALVDAGDRSPRTHATYESALRLHVLPGLGGLQLRECTTARCEAWLEELRRRVGPAMCATARAVLSGILGWAARMEAIPANPVRDLSPIVGAGSRRRKPRAMTRAERVRWLALMDAYDRQGADHRGGGPRGGGRALGDISRFGLATGCRIGETMAVSWDEVDLEAGTVAIRWHLVRAPRKGLVRLPGTKSEAGERVLQLPPWCVDVLMHRFVDEHRGYPVFPDSLGGWRDPNLILRWMRDARGEEFEWVTPHVFRQTVIKELDRAGLATSEIADQAGHARMSHTQDYMERGVASARAAQALEGLL